ncbi:hypothetical protein [Pontiella sulfatireligans]|uniref:DUF1565 domain-containing protein n=1 Tax=Pontiella sulfatireligans TaxID=2750658 RepID=A0A6C2UGQ3_9BACT|nr:hypothetical protein [Pontiella sulfatireligans]VGO19355.1 hypothetical protein SCARR_01413 [Pontiella sulfatireligans]
MRQIGILMLAGMLVAANAMAAKEILVAVSGNDKNPGTDKKPFATVAAARDALRGSGG